MFHVIDDEPMLRELLEAIIPEAGEQYLSHLNSSQFENPVAVLTDVNMPGINGYDLALTIRERHPTQKVVLVAGNPDDEHHQRAAHQLCDTLAKPYRPEILLNLLTSLASCEANKSNNYSQSCGFGIEHNCPFHSTSD